jgi:hypothetical protein
MQTKDFIEYWNKEYKEAFPINYELKWIYEDRWLRIHSLPNSKRYASNEKEYQIILERQNKLIEDLIGVDTEIFISFGQYTNDITNDNYEELSDYEEFDLVLTIPLHQERPNEYLDECHFDVYVKNEFWQKGRRDKMLKAIANDEIRAMFICPSKECIIAPYDGGVDIIVKTSDKRNKLKEKYKTWLSSREDGL